MHKYLTKSIAAAAALTLAVLQLTLLPTAAETPDFSYLGSIGSLTEAQTEAVAESIYEGLASHSSFADFTDKNIAPIYPSQENLRSLMDVYMTVVGGWDVGILAKKNDSSYMMRNTPENGDFVVGMGIYYWVDDETYDAAYADAIDKIDTIVADVNPDWSAPEKALYLHEYLSVHYDYDYDYSENPSTDQEKLPHSAYGMLQNGKAVCDGYAWLYNILLRRVGIESMTVVSTKLNHAWNVLYIDGAWYHVDVTWDDYDAGHPGLVSHKFFLKSRTEMMRSNHKSDDWTLSNGTPESELDSSDLYDASFWNDLNTVVQHYDGTWFAIAPDAMSQTVGWFNQYTFDAATGEAEINTLSSQDQKWEFLDNPGHYYTVHFMIPSVNEGTIYYTTPSAIMAFHNGQHVWICNLTEEQAELGNIYGLYTEGDMLYYAVSRSYGAEAEIFSIDLTEYRERIYAQAGEPDTAPVTSAATVPETTAVVTTEISESTATSVSETEPATTTYTETTTTKTETSATVMTTVTTTETVAAESVSEAPSGDLDGDGELSVLDVIALNRYLLGDTTIGNIPMEQVDLIPDGRIDIFDLAMMKRMLLQLQSSQE